MSELSYILGRPADVTENCLLGEKNPYMFGDQKRQKSNVLCDSNGDVQEGNWVIFLIHAHNHDMR